MADTQHQRILRCSGDTATLLAGKSGAVGFTDGVGDAARFSDPCSITTDHKGVCYVADTGNSAVCVVCACLLLVLLS